MDMKTLKDSQVRRICTTSGNALTAAFSEDSGIEVRTLHMATQGRGNFNVSLNGNQILSGRFSDCHEGVSVSHRLGSEATEERIAKLEGILEIIADKAQAQYDLEKGMTVESRAAADLDTFEM